VASVEQIGIRELRQHASKWIEKVKSGASIQITDRGRPVARLMPVNSTDLERDALTAAGLLIPAATPRTAFDASDLIVGQALTPILDEQRADR
jgi:prevent-host-death family protein